MRFAVAALGLSSSFLLDLPTIHIFSHRRAKVQCNMSDEIRRNVGFEPVRFCDCE